LSKTTQGWLRQEVMRRKIAGGSDAGKYIPGSDARWREEVMLALTRQEATKPAFRSALMNTTLKVNGPPSSDKNEKS